MQRLMDAASAAEINLPLQKNEPVFAAPWEASAFALLVLLHQRKHFAWQDWVAVFAEEIAADKGRTSSIHSYYEIWTRALERMVSACGLVDSDSIDERTEMWRKAYLATPHGQEVLLGNAKYESR
jgi:nitrile hydratase accessory protein